MSKNRAQVDQGGAPFSLGAALVHSTTGTRRVMTITPKSRQVIDRARLEKLGHSSELSPVEKWLVEQTRLRGADARIILFRAVDDNGNRVWQFHEELGENELERAGAVMTRALLPLHRAFLSADVVLMVHTDWGLRECHAMRRGIRVVLDSLKGADPKDPVVRVDRWILENMLLHVALSLDHVTGSLLPTHAGMIERRLPHVRRLVGESGIGVAEPEATR